MHDKIRILTVGKNLPITRVLSEIPNLLPYCFKTVLSFMERRTSK